MIELRRVAFAVLPLLIGATAGAQAPIPIRQVVKDAASATPGPFRVYVRELSDGRVMVAEQARPVAISIFDAKLTTRTVIADSSIFTVGAFAGMLGIAAIPIAGDSSVVPDMNGNSLLVIDATGKVARVLALPRATDARLIIGVGAMSVRFDASGRLVYRGAFIRPPTQTIPGTPRPPTITPDTFPLVRANLETRVVDTLATLSMPTGIRSSMSISEDNKISSKVIRQPLPTTDDWAVLSDGSVAIVRGHDYHIDWIYSDGVRASTPKMAFDWRRVTLEDKERMLDSLRTDNARVVHSRDSMYAARGEKPPTLSFLNEEAVPISEIPDYLPPIRPASVFADVDNNVWILPTTSAAATGGLLYDVVNRRGDLFQRVQLPGGCVVAGFGHGVVYANCETMQSDGKSRTYYLNRFRLSATTPKP